MFSLTSVKSSAMMQSLHFAISLFATFVFNFGFACSIEITNMEQILNLKFLTIANDLKNISHKSVALARLNKCQSDKCLQQVLKINTGIIGIPLKFVMMQLKVK